MIYFEYQTKCSTKWHIVIKTVEVKDKGRILKAEREQNSLHEYKGSHIRLSVELSVEICKPEGSSTIYSKWWMEKLQSSILYPARLTFRIEGKIRSFSDKQKLKQFITTILAL